MTNIASLIQQLPPEKAKASAELFSVYEALKKVFEEKGMNNNSKELLLE